MASSYWSTPKIDWDPSDNVTIDDMNRWESNILAVWNQAAPINDTTGTGSAYLLTVPDITLLEEGTSVVAVIHTDSLDNPTLNLNSLGVKNLLKQDGTAVLEDEFPIGAAIQLIYTNGAWQAVITVKNFITTYYGIYGIDTGSTNNLVVSIPAVLTLSAGLNLSIKMANTNNGTTVLSLNAFGSKSVVQMFGASELNAGNIRSGAVQSLIYDGTNFVLTTPELQTDVEANIQDIDLIEDTTDWITVTQLVNLDDMESDIDINTDKLNNSFARDANDYSGNQKKIGLNDNWEDNSWSGASGTFSEDDTNKLTENGLKCSTSVQFGGIHLVQSFDLTVLENGEESPTSDFIDFALYITTANLANISGTTDVFEVSFINDLEGVLTNYHRYRFDKADVNADDWTYFKAKKSDFTEINSADWATKTGVQIRITGTVTGTVEFTVDKNSLQLVKKHPTLDEPNYFQRNGVIEATVTTSEYYVGKEFGENAIKPLTSTVTLDSLKFTKLYKDFTINSRLTLNAINNTALLLWHVDANNYIYAQYNAGDFDLGVNDNGSSSEKSKTIALSVGDEVNFTINKDGNDITLTAYANNNSDPVILKHTFTGDLLGSLSIGDKEGSVIKSLSIGEISHAHHADVAEVAKSLEEQAKCDRYNSVSQSIPDDAVEFLEFDSFDSDNRNHITSLEETEIREIGRYIIDAMISFLANSTGIRVLQLLINGTVVKTSRKDAAATGATDVSIFKTLDLKKGDIIKLYAYQNSTASLSLETSLATRASMSVTLIN